MKKRLIVAGLLVVLMAVSIYYSAHQPKNSRLKGSSYDVIAWLKKGVKIGNSGNTAQVDSVVLVDGKYKFYIGGIVVSESDDIRISDAQDGSVYFWLKTDTLDGHGKQLATQSDILNIVGGGSGYSEYAKEFTVGDTGFPGAGDSTITSTDWAGRIVKAFRDGTYQRHKAAASNKEGIRVNNTTGQVIFYPPFIADENIIIEAADPTHRYEATISGTESSLLTGLRAFWKLDETSGTNVNDVTGMYNGTTNATVGALGVFGYAETFNGTTQFVDCGTTVGDVGTNDFALAGRIYLTSWPGTYDCAGMAGNWGSYPYFYVGVYGDHKIKGCVNFAGSNIEILSNSVISLNTWYNVVLLADRSANLTLYVNEVAQSDVADISAHSAVNVTNNNTFAIGRVGNSLSGHWWTGRLDDVGLFVKTLTSGEISDVADKTHPW